MNIVMLNCWVTCFDTESGIYVLYLLAEKRDLAEASLNVDIPCKAIHPIKS